MRHLSKAFCKKLIRFPYHLFEISSFVRMPNKLFDHHSLDHASPLFAFSAIKLLARSRLSNVPASSQIPLTTLTVSSPCSRYMLIRSGISISPRGEGCTFLANSDALLSRIYIPTIACALF